MSPKEHVDALAEELRLHFLQIVEANANIRRLLEVHSDGKKLKGDEIVGWVGEIYGKLAIRRHLGVRRVRARFRGHWHARVGED